MRLPKRQLQELKEKKISIEDPCDQYGSSYFVNSKDKSRTSTILKLLNENICDFKQIVDAYKKIEFFGSSYLCSLIKNKELFEELTENNRSTQNDLRYLLNRIDNEHELYEL